MSEQGEDQRPLDVEEGNRESEERDEGYEGDDEEHLNREEVVEDRQEGQRQDPEEANRDAILRVQDNAAEEEVEQVVDQEENDKEVGDAEQTESEGEEVKECSPDQQITNEECKDNEVQSSGGKVNEKGTAAIKQDEPQQRAGEGSDGPYVGERIENKKYQEDDKQGDELKVLEQNVAEVKQNKPNIDTREVRKCASVPISSPYLEPDERIIERVINTVFKRNQEQENVQNVANVAGTSERSRRDIADQINDGEHVIMRVKNDAYESDDEPANGNNASDVRQEGPRAEEQQIEQAGHVIRRVRNYKRVVRPISENNGVVDYRHIFVRADGHSGNGPVQRQPTPRVPNVHPTDPQTETRSTHKIIRPIPQRVVFTPREAQPPLPMYFVQPEWLQHHVNPVIPEAIQPIIPEPLPPFPYQPLQQPLLQHFLMNIIAPPPPVPSVIDNIYNRPPMPPPYALPTYPAPNPVAGPQLNLPFHLYPQDPHP